MSEAALAAVRHIIHRVATDSDFAWFMVATESLHLCCIAAAEERQLDLNEYKRLATDAANEQMKRVMPRVKELEAMRNALMAQVDLLTDQLSDAIDSQYDDDDDDDELTIPITISSSPASIGPDRGTLSDLLHYCRLRDERPTVEAVEAAVRGVGIGRCLQLMESVVI